MLSPEFEITEVKREQDALRELEQHSKYLAVKKNDCSLPFQRLPNFNASQRVVLAEDPNSCAKQCVCKLLTFITLHIRTKERQHVLDLAVY